jgi:hypothetical protein
MTTSQTASCVRSKSVSARSLAPGALTGVPAYRPIWTDRKSSACLRT